MGMFDLLRAKIKRLGGAETKEGETPSPPRAPSTTFERATPRAPPAPAQPAPPSAVERRAPEVPRPEARPAAPVPAPAATTPPPVRGKGVAPEKVKELLYDLELMLLEADVALPVVETIKEGFKKRLATVDPGGNLQRAVEEALKETLLELLSKQTFDFDQFVLEHEKPVVLMFVGVNGTGKTTQIAKVAQRLRGNGYSSVLAAGDTFRAGAIEQIEKHSERLNMKVVKHVAGADPAAVAYDAIQHAKSRKKDVVLIDTAGRMQTNLNLMDEMKKIKRVAKPHLVVFVGDALAGNDAVEQARKFDEAVGIGCVFLTKVDTDAKGGAALSIANAVGKPVAFLGVGQEYEDLIPFDPAWVVDRIFGE